MEDWQKQKLLESDIHDYLVMKKNMETTAAILALEASTEVAIDDSGEGFLAGPWSLIWEPNCFKGYQLLQFEAEQAVGAFEEGSSTSSDGLGGFLQRNASWTSNDAPDGYEPENESSTSNDAPDGYDPENESSTSNDAPDGYVPEIEAWTSSDGSVPPTQPEPDARSMLQRIGATLQNTCFAILDICTKTTDPEVSDPRQAVNPAEMPNPAMESSLQHAPPTEEAPRPVVESSLQNAPPTGEVPTPVAESSLQNAPTEVPSPVVETSLNAPPTEELPIPVAESSLQNAPPTEEVPTPVAESSLNTPPTEVPTPVMESLLNAPPTEEVHTPVVESSLQNAPPTELPTPVVESSLLNQLGQSSESTADGMPSPVMPSSPASNSDEIRRQRQILLDLAVQMARRSDGSMPPNMEELRRQQQMARDSILHLEREEDYARFHLGDMYADSSDDNVDE